MRPLITGSHVPGRIVILSNHLTSEDSHSQAGSAPFKFAKAPTHCSHLLRAEDFRNRIEDKELRRCEWSQAPAKLEEAGLYCEDGDRSERGEAEQWGDESREARGGDLECRLREVPRKAQMAVACGGLATGIGGVVTPATANYQQLRRPRAASMPARCSVVAVSKRALSSAPFEFGDERREEEPRLIASRRMVSRASADSAGVASTVNPTASESEEEPKPIVHIDQDSDAEATIVEISYGNRLGALLDTIKALQNLGLNVVRGMVVTEGAGMRRKRFLVTHSYNNKKVVDPEMLEAIRLTVINNLLQYHPESSEQLALGVALGGVAPRTELDVDVATHISVTRDGPRSLLSVETADRPGLLLEILQVIRDISVYVESAEIDTEGLVAKDRFYLTYHGEVLSSSMEEVLTNALRYYLRKPETEEDSY